jgi:hypothetical protein
VNNLSGICDLWHMSMEVNYISYCHRKKCTFTMTSNPTYILFLRDEQGPFTHLVCGK